MRLTLLFRAAALCAFLALPGAMAQQPDTLKHSLFSPSVSAPQNDAQQGYSLAVDGDLVAVGAPFDDIGGQDSGVVKVYDRASGALLHMLANPSPVANDQFGGTVAVSGTLVVVGAPLDDTGAADSGSAYVYDLASATPSVPLATLNNPSPGFDARFGNSVAVSGTRVVVGVPRGAVNLVGRAYVYDLASATPTVPVTTLNNPSPAFADRFGNSVAVDGTRAVVGAPLDDTGAADAGSAYVYDLASATPAVPVVTLNNPTPAANDLFGWSVAVNGTRVVVGAHQDDTGATDAGSAYVYDLTSATPTVPVATLNNPSPELSDRFGWSVAVGGARVVVGAYQDDTGMANAGSAYVYDVATATPTVPVVTLNNPSLAGGDEFGISVAASGTRVVVGAHQDDTAATNAGSAYVYDLASATPTVPGATLNNPSPAGNDQFGHSVAVSGTRVVIGVPFEDTGASDAGSAYVFDLASATPNVPVATLHNPNPAAVDWFGHSVAVSGTRVVVGALFDDTGASDAGSAYVYDLASATPTVPVTTLNNPSPALDDRFGNSVAVSGTLVLVTAYLDDPGVGNSGTAYVYDLASTTPTVPVTTLNNPTPGDFDQFGISVAVSGARVVVGAYRDDTGATDAGSAYVYDLAGATPTVPVATLHNPSSAANDLFGWSVAIRETRVVVGANQDDTGATDAGSAYVYDLASATPTVPVATLNNPTPAANDWFGRSVAVSGTLVVVGANQDDTGATNAGSAYVYDLAAANPTVPVATLNNPTPATLDNFGNSVAVDGIFAVIGAYWDDTVVANKGAAYVFGPAAAAPDAITGGASFITRFSAILNGTASANGAETTVAVEYDTDITDGAYSSSSNLGTTTAASAPFSTVLSDLQPGTTYHYRFVATNAVGATQGLDATFTTTANLPPIANAGGPYSTREDVTLTLDASGSSDPEGDAIISYEWDFNFDGTYDVSTANPVVALTVAMRQQFGTVQPDQYTARVRVTDQYGGQHAADFAFTLTPKDPQSRVLYSKGDAVPGAGQEGSGIPADSVWKTFGVPSNNRSGTTAFLAAIASPTGSASAIFKGELVGIEPTVVARSKQAVFGAPAGVIYKSFKDPLLNERGDIAFLANLSGTGVTAASDQALFVVSTDNDSDGLVARERAEPAGVTGARWKAFTSVAFAEENAPGGAWTLAFTATMVPGPGLVTTANDSGLWIADATGVKLALREGQRLEARGQDRVIKAIQALNLPIGAVGHGFGATAGGVPALVTFVDRTRALLRVTVNDLEGGGVAIETVAFTGDTIQGVDVTLGTIGLPTQNGSGGTTVSISSLNTELNASAVVRADRGADPVMVVRKGDPLTSEVDSPVFESFTSAVMNDTEHCAILGQVRDGVVTRGNEVAIMRRNGGAEWEMVARKGTQPPGVPEGAKFASFPSYALGDGGTLAYVGKLVKSRAGDRNPAKISAANDTGLWIALPGEPPQLLLREGDILGTRKVRTFSALTTISGSASQRRTFNADGSDLLVRVIATDGTQHVLHIALPAIKVP